MLPTFSKIIKNIEDKSNPASFVPYVEIIHNFRLEYKVEPSYYTKHTNLYVLSDTPFLIFISFIFQHYLQVIQHFLQHIYPSFISGFPEKDTLSF